MTAQLYTASWSALYAAHKAGGLDVQPVRISRGGPRFWPGAKAFPALHALMPDGWMLSIPENKPEHFTRAYRRKLDSVGVETVRRQLGELAERCQRPLGLACFEKDRADCHRGDFAAWWEDQTGEQIPEWSRSTEPESSNVGHRVREAEQ